MKDENDVQCGCSKTPTSTISVGLNNLIEARIGTKAIFHDGGVTRVYELEVIGWANVTEKDHSDLDTDENRNCPYKSHLEGVCLSPRKMEVKLVSQIENFICYRTPGENLIDVSNRVKAIMCWEIGDRTIRIASDKPRVR